MTPEERSEKARKAARARWALGATEKRRVRAFYYHRRIERAIASGNVRWLDKDLRIRLAKDFLYPPFPDGTYAEVHTGVVGASQPKTGGSGDPESYQPWSDADARAGAQPAFPRSGTNARGHATTRLMRRKLRQAR